jgi:hypothetical protein
MKTKKTQKEFLDMELTEVIFVKKLPPNFHMGIKRVKIGHDLVMNTNVYFKLRSDGAILAMDRPDIEHTASNAYVFKLKSPYIKNLRRAGSFSRLMFRLVKTRDQDGTRISIKNGDEIIDWLTPFDVKMLRQRRLSIMKEKGWKTI